MKIRSAIILISLLVPQVARGQGREVYLDLMQRAVEAYSPERIEEYTADVDKEGIREHGYARLTSNLGILVSHGRLPEMKDTFIRMMDICARELPVANARNGWRGGTGNDFAVKEICSCILAAEESGLFPKEKTDAWRTSLSGMKAEDIYTEQPELGDPKAHNWCVYGASSECARIWAGIGGDRGYADKYIGDQLRFFDDNGMYRDPHQPMVYDIVTRLQFMMALFCGYDGPSKEALETQLMKSALPTLQMQSVTGEIPYGGRSNQFLHNETFMAAVCEYYATWMKRLGNMEMAARFKAAAMRAVSSLDYWTSRKPVRHIKNRYPTETRYGCEDYAYFNKYMVTMGSWAYMAYLFADDSIKPAARPEKPSTFVMGPDFHRIVMNRGGYTVQFDTDAQKEYDSNGIGRIQKAGAPPVIALASPCPATSPNFTTDMETAGPLAVAPLWDRYELVTAVPGKVVLTDGVQTWTSRLGRRGLRMTLSGKGKLAMTLPALIFDGEKESIIKCDGRSLTVEFDGWRCRYTTNGRITDSGKIHASRNGHLRRYDVEGTGRLKVKVTISSSLSSGRGQE